MSDQEDIFFLSDKKPDPVPEKPCPGLPYPVSPAMLHNILEGQMDCPACGRRHTPVKQDDVFLHVKFLIEKFPKGFIIITAPDSGATCQMYKWNPRFFRIFNEVEEFVKKISGWNAGGLN